MSLPPPRKWTRFVSALTSALLLLCCASEPPKDASPPPPPVSDCSYDTSPVGQAAAESLDPALFEYAWQCHGEVPATGAALSSAPPADDCSQGIWFDDLDPAVDACPTVTDQTRVDPDSGTALPPADTRPLPVDIRVSESGSFLPANTPASFPSKLRVVTWNMEYSAHLDEQIETLVTDPATANADVYLLSEVDRCSTRNGIRRAARLLAQRLQAEYVYGVEYVELSIGRTIGGDTGQAILSRRPLRGAALTCLSQQKDWFADNKEPRLGQRIALHADVPVGNTFVRVYSTHLESSDLTGERRVLQAREVLDSAQQLACDRPTIVAGDLNAWYCQTPELEVFRKAGFLDVLQAAGDTGVTHPSNNFRLDYIWAKRFRVTGGGVLRDVTTSDHYPVWADLEVQ